MHPLSGFSHFVSVSLLHALCRHIWDLGGALQGKVQLWEDDRQRDRRTSLRGRIHCGRPLWGAYCVTNVVDYSVRSCKPLLQELNCLWVWKDTTVWSLLLCKPHTQATPTTLTWEWHGSKVGFNKSINFSLQMNTESVWRTHTPHLLTRSMAIFNDTEQDVRFQNEWLWKKTTLTCIRYRNIPISLSMTSVNSLATLLEAFCLPTDAKALLMCTGINNDIIPLSCDMRLQYVSLIAIFHDEGMFLNLLLLSENSNDNLVSPFTPTDSTSWQVREPSSTVPPLQHPIFSSLLFWELHKGTHDAQERLWESQTRGPPDRNHCRCWWACVS